MDPTMLPSSVDIKQYIEERSSQVAELLQMVDNTKLVAGEVTKGPRTAAQRLPRHMRRRAMAYEVRRFPRRLRDFAAPYINSNHCKKPPSRFSRRRPTNMLMNYMRRQRKCKWLETHIWHAKRFHMTERWGYRVAERCFQRGFRPVMRDSLRKCVIRDQSYFSCLVVKNSSQDYIISKLSPLFGSGAGPTFAFKSACRGGVEVSANLYVPEKYPNGFIASVRFLWHVESANSSLLIWCHPATKNDILQQLTKIFQLQEVDNVEKLQTEPNSFEEFRLQDVIGRKIYTGSDGIFVEDASDNFSRFSLCGPKSISVIAQCLKLVDSDEYRPNHEQWRDVCNSVGASFGNGAALSLLVEDPRIVPIRKGGLTSEKGVDADASIICPLVRATCRLWNHDDRVKALKQRLSDSEMNSLKGNKFDEIAETKTKIPVVIVVRASQSAPLSGVNFICPSGFGKDFFVRFHLRGARASSYADELAVHAQTARLHWSCVPDCNAGQNEIRQIRDLLQMAYLRRPANRRPIFWDRLSVKFPFEYNFAQLISDWCQCEQIEDSRLFVVRERLALRRLNAWLSSDAPRPDELLSQFHEGLVPITVQCIRRGRPKQFALLCLPSSADLTVVNSKGSLKQELRRANGNSNEVDDAQFDGNKQAMSGLVSLDPAKTEQHISLKDVFTEKIVLKSQKRRLMNKKKKDRAKRRKLDREESAKTEEERQVDMNEHSYRSSADRPIVGRCVSGDQSLCSGSGRAVAFVPVAALDDVKRTFSILLLRNITSLHYHPVKVTLLLNDLEL